MTMKMWCLCTKKNGKPIKILLDSPYYGDTDTIGFATKGDLLEAIGKSIEHDEVVRRIDFEY